MSKSRLALFTIAIFIALASTAPQLSSAQQTAKPEAARQSEDVIKGK